MNPSIRRVCLKAGDPVSAAISCIEASGGEIALVIDDAGRLLGTITDGDIRRGLLAGADITTPAQRIMNPRPHTAPVGTSTAQAAALLRRDKLEQMPIVDSDGVLVDLIIGDRIYRSPAAEHPVVIMAGGMGTRLLPITETIPKPMIPVGGRPILEVIIERLADQGFRSVTLCVNYLAEVIEDHFEDGSRLGVDISYIRETKRMGTAGALSLMPQRPILPVIVTNCDILTAVNFNQLLSFHYENNALATMGLNRFQYQMPYGVVEVKNHHILSFSEKPIYDFFVNAGIYVVSPEALDLVPSNIYFDMPSLFERVHVDQRVAFPIHEYWLDIGRHEDLEKATREFEANFPVNDKASDTEPSAYPGRHASLRQV